MAAPEYQRGNFGAALTAAFLDIDEMLLEPEAAEELVGFRYRPPGAPARPPADHPKSLVSKKMSEMRAVWCQACDRTSLMMLPVCHAMQRPKPLNLVP